MLADAIGIVVGHRRCDDDSGLHVIAHLQAINVVMRLGIADEHAFPGEAVQILCACLVHHGGVRICARGKIDLGF